MFNSNSKIFEEKLTRLINESGLTISEAYYIVENASLKLKLLFNEMIMQEKNNSALEEEKHVDINFENQKQESEASE